MNFIKKSGIWVSVVLLLFSGQIYSQKDNSSVTVLTNGHLIDGTGRALLRDITLVIEDNIIKKK